jgi:hypothetical protein
MRKTLAPIVEPAPSRVPTKDDPLSAVHAENAAVEFDSRQQNAAARRVVVLEFGSTQPLARLD